MIVTINGKPVDRNFDGQSSTFSIKASAHAFKILAGNLYSDRIGAVVRELVCNAYDSHVEAGHQEPISIHTPNVFEPWFSVLDNGVGISHEFMMSGYTTAFLSTNKNPNKQKRYCNRVFIQVIP